MEHLRKQAPSPNGQAIRCTRADLIRRLPLALACASLPVSAQNESSRRAAAPSLDLDLKRIASALAAMVDDGRAAGVSVLIWKDGREAYFGAAGFADRESERRMSR